LVTQFFAIKKLDKECPDFLPLALVLLVALSLYFIGLHTFGIIDPGEAYYAEAAREMVESGDYLTPHLNYQIYFSKPILTFWLMAFAYKIFGISEFSTRIIFACLVVGLLTGTYWLARNLYGRRCGIFASLIAATMPLLLACAKISPIDIAFACFLDLFAFALVFSVFLKRSQWTVFVYIFLALAALTKGPAAFVLAALGTLAFLVVERADWSVNVDRLRKLNLPLGLIILAAITLPWYCAVGFATQGLFLKVFLLYENLARFAGMTNMAHTTWYHYGLVMIYGLFPWIVFLPESIWSAIKPALKGKMTAVSQSVLFLACWSLSVIVFFSISRTQLDTYILPAVAPLAIVIACYIEVLIDKLSANVSNKTSISVINLVLGFIGVLALIFAFSLPAIRLPAKLLATVGASDLFSLKICLFLMAIVLAVGYLFQYFCYKTKKYFAMFVTLLITTVVVAAGTTQIAFQMLDKSGQCDLRIICEELKGSCDSLAVFQAFKPSIMFYSLKPVTSFFHASQLLPLSEQQDERQSGSLPKQLIILNQKALPLLKVSPTIQLLLVKRRGPWLLYQVKNAKFEDMQTLERMFSNWPMMTRLMKNQSDVGPLTVPYAAGAADWWQEKGKNK
jgi:4-amino-4-deoxy-L-arabinose transferase-like glycosyltransferase